MMELKNVSISYGPKIVLSQISLRVEGGKVTVLVGPNGSGKTTLLRAMLGVLPLREGEILCDGRPLWEWKLEELAKQIAYLPQTRTLHSVTAEHVVLHGRFPYLGIPRRYTMEDRRIAREAMKVAGCEKLAGRRMDELSGGERQSIYFAMALAQQTPIVLMDEPTTYLDIPHQMTVLRMARHMAEQGKAVVLVMHDLPLALRVADQIAVLADATLVTAGTPEEVLKSGVLASVFGVEIVEAKTSNGTQFFLDAII